MGGFMFWGLFVALGTVVGGYVVWLLAVERGAARGPDDAGRQVAHDDGELRP